jgi:hypothetical protein
MKIKTGLKKKSQNNQTIIFNDSYLNLLTVFVQYIDGTGLPDALHSSVTEPLLRAVSWPVVGTARTLGGTGMDLNQKKKNVKTNHIETINF